LKNLQEKINDLEKEKLTEEKRLHDELEHIRT
jgi:hypothetical protein